MQDLIILNSHNVIIQSNGKAYYDTFENFVVDYGELPKIKYVPSGHTMELQVDITQIDYNRETQQCYLNDSPFQTFPNEICEDILDSIDTLLEKQKERNYVAQTLDELKAEKLMKVSVWTAEKITGGFVSNASGEPVRYDSDIDTQITMSRIRANCENPRFAELYPNGCPVRGYPQDSDVKQIYMLTAEQIIEWDEDLGIHIGNCKTAGWDKQNKVKAAQTKEELDAIELN
ncbi:hypothetical protein [uncultured Phascolarctobacterium sp.]|uniref:hypothetical protein n=1 Tax=uncultured Phascolarctobacterium sp. TaxID=512296 RepID=UPI0027D9A0D4|nr:hypothetical protein [uncultured Phascolarctobacterium sp.]